MLHVLFPAPLFFFIAIEKQRAREKWVFVLVRLIWNLFGVFFLFGLQMGLSMHANDKMRNFKGRMYGENDIVIKALYLILIK